MAESQRSVRTANFKDIAGQRFGKLTVLREFTEEKRLGGVQWVCQCDCGNEKIARGDLLRRGATRHCGCSRTRKPKIDRKVTEIGGQRFGKLVALEFDSFRGANGQFWKFRCDCGIEKAIRIYAILSGSVVSCGCYGRIRGFKHGLSRSSERQIWEHMIARCEDPDEPGYELYGGRGIAVCERWRKSLVDFVADMGRRPSKRHSIDRRDNDGNYEPDNCRWATPKEQVRNRSITLRVTHLGESRPLAEWCERFGLDYEAVYYRMRHGYTPETGLFAPSGSLRT